MAAHSITSLLAKQVQPTGADALIEVFDNGSIYTTALGQVESVTNSSWGAMYFLNSW